MRILVVEDDRGISNLLARGLSEEGHSVKVANSLREALSNLELHALDALIVDRGLPDGDGLDLVRGLRTEGDERPVLVLTARDGVSDRVEGLYGGADDYLVKPFVLDELLARLAAVTRRTGTGGGRLVIGDLVVDTAALRVWRGGDEVRLTALEFRLLSHLAECRGQVQTRARLLEAVWDLQEDPGSNVVDVYISYLRSKIDKGRDSALLRTVRGIGYVLEDPG